MIHIFHKWDKWKEIEKGDISLEMKSIVIGKYIIQERECDICGKKQLKEVESW